VKSRLGVKVQSRPCVFYELDANLNPDAAHHRGTKTVDDQAIGSARQRTLPTKR